MKFRLAIVLATCVLFAQFAYSQCVSLTTLGSSYNQNFDTLASTGTSTALPTGWFFNETGTNANTLYTASSGGTSASFSGDTYSFGATGSAERSLGGVQSSSLIPTIGACFTNNTGAILTSLAVSYTGEQWRFGATGRTDRLDFQISSNATTLTTGTWSDIDALDFSSPNTSASVGALDGNATANRSAVASTITGLSIPTAATFWIRWTDFNASGADDGLSVDDFFLTPSGTIVANNSPSINTPPNPIATVQQNAAPFNVSLIGSDDGGIYNWSGTAGMGVSSVIVASGQGTANVSYQVTLASNFTGTATFTASLSDNVNPAVTRQVNIEVNSINNAPTITPPNNPITAVEANAPAFTVSLTGLDDGGVYNWSATSGTGVSLVSVTSGQGTSTATFTVTLQGGFSGTATFTASLSDNVNAPATQAVNITVTPPPPPPNHVVISQLYGGGGNTGATYANDYIELYNPTNSIFDLTGWTLQYQAATSTGTWANFQPLGGTIGPGEYFLVSLASGGAIGASLPAANVIGGSTTINMSATAGKLALVSNGDPLSGCPVGADPDVVDFIGYGTTANCKEGSSAAPASSNTTALFRRNGGAVDTDVNGSDFTVGAPNPRRTAPIVDFGPAIVTTDPISNAGNVPRDASVTVTFTKPVDVIGQWYNLTCATTGGHNDALVEGGPTSYVIIPSTNFLAGEQCTVTVFKNAVHDQDLASTSSTIPADKTWSFTVSTGAAPVYGPEVHLTMGNPSNAVADVNVPNNYLMMKPEYALSFNRDRGEPNWVSWHLSNDWTGSLVRVDTFRSDPALPTSWYHVLGTDFSNSGFDRGHMCPNADREFSIPINQATFLMTNMVPQSPDNNQGPWETLESYLRSLLPANEIYIVAGPAGTGGTGSNGFATTVASGRVVIPASTWKVALVLPKADDNDLSRVTAATRTIAIKIPNIQGIRNDDWTKYLTSVDAVEALTGYNLFSNVPEAIQNAIEAGVNGVNPPGAANVSVSTSEDKARSFTFDVASPNNNSLIYTIVSTPVHGSLSTNCNVTCTYTPASDYNGSDTFTYNVSDGTHTSNTATVTVSVLEVNDPPVAADDSKTTDEDTTLTFFATDLMANDSAGPANESGQSLSVTAMNPTANTHGSVSLSSGQVSYMPDADYNGPASFTYTVCDNGITAGLSDPLCSTATVNVTVNPVNDAPVLDPINDQSVEVGGTLTFTAHGSDIDSPTLTYSLMGAPDGATINATTGLFTWTPLWSQANLLPYTFNVAVFDGAVSASRTVNVTVTDTTAPTISPLSLSTTQLWPPLHQMVNVTVAYSATDAGDPAPVCSLRISSNEPINGTGDGDMAPDWEIVDANHIRLRAERSGSGNGRIYTIGADCADRFGNLSQSGPVTVTVPRDQR